MRQRGREEQRGGIYWIFYDLAPPPGIAALILGLAWETPMLVSIQTRASQDEIDHVLQAIREMKLTPHPMPGATRTAIGITGNVGAVDPRLLEVQPGVSELIRVTKPHTLAGR